MLRVLEWVVPDEGMRTKVLVDISDDRKGEDTPLKSHIVSTVLAQLIEDVDIIAWDQNEDEIDVFRFRNHGTKR